MNENKLLEPLVKFFTDPNNDFVLRIALHDVPISRVAKLNCILSDHICLSTVSGTKKGTNNERK